MKRKWTYDACKELVSKYEYFTDFRKQQESAYVAIIANGWRDDLLKKLKRTRKPNKYWTYERCKEHALKCTKRKNLKWAVRQKIYENRWFELLEHMEYQTSIIERYIYVFEFEDNHVYVGLSYNPEIRKDGHLNNIKEKSSVLGHIEKTNSKYHFKVLTGPLTVKDACYQECRYIDEYKSNGWVLLNRTTGGNPGCKPFKWTYEKCKNKISEYKTLRDFTNSENGCYLKILKKRWMELLEPLERRGEITKDYEYYLNRYPKVVKLIEENIPNNKVAKMAGCSVSNVVVIKRFLRESKKLTNKEDLFFSKPQTLKIIELLKLKYPRADIMREANTSLSTILKVIKVYYEKTGIDLYYRYYKKNLHLKHHKPLSYQKHKNI